MFGSGAIYHNLTNVFRTQVHLTGFFYFEKQPEKQESPRSGDSKSVSFSDHILLQR